MKIRSLLLVSIIAGATLLASAGDVQYVYDDAGRLVGVVNAAGESAQYVYDPAGNITEIKRLAVGELSVLEFLPKSGTVGMAVTIWGSGFSATGSLNAVTVNGVPATVTSAAPNKLVVTVPTGATTGPVAVTVSGATRTSMKNFTVIPTDDCTAIVGTFSPNIGTTGTTVTLAGNGYQSSGNSVLFNATAGAIASATASSLVTSVPSGATSGRLTVNAAPRCNSVTPGDFYVPPPPNTVGDIGSTGRLTFGGPAATFSIPAGKKGLYLFDGTARRGGSVYLTGSTLGSNTGVDLLAPDGSTVNSTTLFGTDGRIGPLNLPVTGGYSILVRPTNAGSVTLQVGAPDFAISNVSVGTITENKNGSFNIPVSFTVTNVGSASQAPSWFDMAYLSNNDRLDRLSTYVGSTAHGTALAPGGSYSVNPTYTTSGVGPGTYMLFMQADGTQSFSTLGEIIESNETNNISPGIPVVLPTYPDLTIASASVGAVTVNQNGSFSVPFSFTTTNVGATPAQPSWQDYVYLSGDATLDEADKILGSVTRSSVLQPSMSYSTSQTFAVTGTSPGAYTVFVKADGQGSGYITSNGQVVEAGEANNVYAISLELPTYPDLALSNPTLGTVVVNRNGSFDIPIDFTVTNVGTTTAQPTWIDYAYLSRNGALDAATATLGTAFRSMSLASGASYSVSRTFNTTAFTPGNYTLFFKTDGKADATASGFLTESSEANNTSTGIAMTLPTYPDLGITNSSVGSVTVNKNGSFNIPVSFTVANLGTTTAQPTWNDHGYVSSNGLLDSSSTSIGSSFRGTALAGGASYAVTQTYVTSGVSPGTYTLFLKADGQPTGQAAGNGFLVESDETNNATAGVSVVLPGYPDLSVSSASVGAITKSGSTYSIPVTFTVTNTGASPAQPNWNDTGYLSSNGALDGSSASIGITTRASVLAPGDSYTVSTTYSVSTFPAGNYTLFIKADGAPNATTNGVVVEAAESNNASAGIAVTLP